MSTVILIAAVIALLGALICYAFISQTIEKKRKQRQRVLTALRVRSNNFAHMLRFFPQDFLTKELHILVYKCLCDVVEQLATLEPDNPEHIESLEAYQNQIAHAQKRTQSMKRVHFDNPSQIKECRTQLQELFKFVEKLQAKGTITPPQAKTYGKQIQKLMLQISVDGYLIHAKHAHNSNKLRLAVHYYSLARKLLIRENADKSYSKQISQFDEIIKQLEDEIISSSTPESQENVPTSSEWNEFEEGEGWKKKNVYD